MDQSKWNKICLKKRKNIVRKNSKGENEYLLANFSGSKQAIDITREKKSLLVEDFFRIKTNVVAWDPKEKETEKNFDFRNNSNVFNSMRNEFDIPYCAFHNMIGGPLVDHNDAFTFQVKDCTMYCPWCFVDDKNKDGKQRNGMYYTVSEIMEYFLKLRGNQTCNIIRSSGGEPTLAIEIWHEVCSALSNFPEWADTVALWGDTNLTTGHFIDFLEKEKIVEKHIRKKIGKYKNPWLLCSFKGTDTESFLKAAGYVNKNGAANKKYSFLRRGAMVFI